MDNEVVAASSESLSSEDAYAYSRIAFSCSAEQPSSVNFAVMGKRLSIQGIASGKAAGVSVRPAEFIYRDADQPLACGGHGRVFVLCTVFALRH